jgi:hypothetical protein
MKEGRTSGCRAGPCATLAFWPYRTAGRCEEYWGEKTRAHLAEERSSPE